jgi:hypothetical protein
MKRKIIFGVLIIPLVLFLFYFIIPNTSQQTIDTQGVRWKLTKPIERERILFREFVSGSKSLDLHYRIINNHYKIPLVYSVGKRKVERRDDNYLKSFYSTLSFSKDSILREISNFGFGRIAIEEKTFHEATKYFNDVKNINAKYVNWSRFQIADAYKKSINEKIDYLKKEVDNNGALDLAIPIYYNFLRHKGQDSLINDIVQNPKYNSYISLVERRQYNIESGQFKEYFKLLFCISDINLYGFIISLIIAFFWTYYVIYVDIFEKGVVFDILTCLILGFYLYFLNIICIDFISKVEFPLIEFYLFGNPMIKTSILFFLQEVIKIIPLFLYLYFTKSVNEPYDLLKYASLSAIGFNFASNLNQIDLNQLIFLPNFMIANPIISISTSATIAYLYILYKYRTSINLLLFCILAIIIPLVINIVYYLFSTGEHMVKLFFLIPLFVIIISNWKVAINNTINISPFFTKDIYLNRRFLENRIFFIGVAILLFHVVFSLYYYDYFILIISIISYNFLSLILIKYLYHELSLFKIKKNLWQGFQSSEKDMERIDIEKLEGLQIIMESRSNDILTNQILPIYGIIDKAVDLNTDNFCYLFIAHNKFKTDKFNDQHLLIIPVHDFKISKENMAGLYFIKGSVDLSKLKKEDLHYGGWVKMDIKPN